MRQSISISLPPDLKRFVDRSVKAGRYSTTSEFIRDLIRRQQKERVINDLLQSELEMKGGESKILRSLKSLR